MTETITTKRMTLGDIYRCIAETGIEVMGVTPEQAKQRIREWDIQNVVDETIKFS